MKVAVIYNEPEPTNPSTHWLSRSNRTALPADFVDASEYGVLEHVAGITQALRDAGEQTTLHAAASADGLAAFLANEQPDVVFNCCESFRDNATLEMSVAALFDLFGIAYTGSPALTLGLALDKALSKALFRAYGIPTAPHIVARSPADLARADALTYPLIVKPVAEDASIGIDANAVVNDFAAAAERVKFVTSEFHQPAIVEEFVSGRELNVALLARPQSTLEALPISEVLFDTLPVGMPAIVSYEAKWVVDSPAYRATPPRCPAVLDPELAGRVRDVALAAARAVGLRDYGRVDIRLRARDQAVLVLEVNPNPDLSADAGFMRAAIASGETFATTVQRILACATARARRPHAPGRYE